MVHIRDLITLTILFFSLYFEVFLLITYLENRKQLTSRRHLPALNHPELPGVTIIVPCFNEERTVGRTLDSLFELDYAKNQLHIIAVNDGSKDGTMEIFRRYANRPNFQIIDKENGGKHTALNLGIKMATTPYVGCLDADSYVKKDALIRLMRRFDKENIMAVVPSLHVYSPKSLIQRMQKVEYLIGIFLRSILAELNALYVTPGPFSIFKKEVFEKIGYYRKAHNTEDMEMAMRMQANGLKIASAHDAVVYTSSPKSVHKLYKQRVRWTSGFLKNIIDYRFMLLRFKYGHIGGFVLPMALLSSVALLFAAVSLVFDVVSTLQHWYISYTAIGTKMFALSLPSFDLFYAKTPAVMFGGIVALIALLLFITIGTRLSDGSRARLFEIVSYVCLYSFIAPFWLVKSIYNVVFSKQLSWR